MAGFTGFSFSTTTSSSSSSSSFSFPFSNPAPSTTTSPVGFASSATTSALCFGAVSSVASSTPSVRFGSSAPSLGFGFGSSASTSSPAVTGSASTSSAPSLFGSSSPFSGTNLFGSSSSSSSFTTTTTPLFGVSSSTTATAPPTSSSLFGSSSSSSPFGSSFLTPSSSSSNASTSTSTGFSLSSSSFFKPTPPPTTTTTPVSAPPSLPSTGFSFGPPTSSSTSTTTTTTQSSFSFTNVSSTPGASKPLFGGSTSSLFSPTTTSTLSIASTLAPSASSPRPFTGFAITSTPSTTGPTTSFTGFGVSSVSTSSTTTSSSLAGFQLPSSKTPTPAALQATTTAHATAATTTTTTTGEDGPVSQERLLESPRETRLPSPVRADLSGQLEGSPSMADQTVKETKDTSPHSTTEEASTSGTIDAPHSQRVDPGTPLTPSLIPFSVEDLDAALSELQSVAVSFDLSPSSRLNPSIAKVKDDLRPLLQSMNNQPLTFSRHADLLALLQGLRDSLPSSILSTVRPHLDSLHSVVNLHQAQNATYLQKTSTFYQVEATLMSQASRAQELISQIKASQSDATVLTTRRLEVLAKVEDAKLEIARFQRLIQEEKREISSIDSELSLATQQLVTLHGEVKTLTGSSKADQATAHTLLLQKKDLEVSLCHMGHQAVSFLWLLDDL